MKVVLATVALLASASALSADERQTILDFHNTKRKRIANGEEPTFSTYKAADMQKMRYDFKIEGVIQNYLTQCHDVRNGNRGNQVEAVGTYAHLDPTAKFNSNCGENLYKHQGTGEVDDFYINAALNAWYDEVTNNGYTYREWSGSASDFNSANFSQMIWANTRYIGCGIKKCGGFTLVGCDYVNAGNVEGHYPYALSSKPASDCPTDMPTDRGGLCDGCGNRDVYKCVDDFENCGTDLRPYCNNPTTAWVALECKLTCGTGGCGNLPSEPQCNDGTAA